MSIPPAARRVPGVEPLSISTRSGHVAALRCGPGDGTPILLVPGFTGSKEDFLPILPALGAAGWAVTSIDQPGQFESPGLPDYPEGCFADVLSDVIAALGARVHLVGHSFGGLVSRETTLARPDTVASLTLLCSGPAALPVEHHALLTALRQMIPVADLEQIWQAKKLLDEQSGVPQPDAETDAFLHERWVANDPRCLFAMAGTLMTATDRTDELANLGHRIPLGVMFGVDDATAWPVADQREMARRLGVAPVAIPDAAHSPAVENPDTTARELLAFVTSHQV